MEPSRLNKNDIFNIQLRLKIHEMERSYSKEGLVSVATIKEMPVSYLKKLLDDWHEKDNEDFRNKVIDDVKKSVDGLFSKYDKKNDCNLLLLDVCDPYGRRFQIEQFSSISKDIWEDNEWSESLHISVHDDWGLGQVAYIQDMVIRILMFDSAKEHLQQRIESDKSVDTSYYSYLGITRDYKIVWFFAYYLCDKWHMVYQHIKEPVVVGEL